MKSLSLYLLLLVFLANTTIATVWAQPCMMDKDSMSMKFGASMTDEMPCHDQIVQEEQKDSQNPDQNCEELCLFLNVLTSHASIISSNNISVPASKSIRILIDKESIDSIESLPLYRPPIILS